MRGVCLCACVALLCSRHCRGWVWPTNEWVRPTDPRVYLMRALSLRSADPLT